MPLLLWRLLLLFPLFFLFLLASQKRTSSQPFRFKVYVGEGFFKMYCTYLSVTYLLIITKSMINLSWIRLLSNPNHANAFLSLIQKAALLSVFTSMYTKAHIHSSCRALVTFFLPQVGRGCIMDICVAPPVPVQWFISSTLVGFNDVIFCK